ncbi:hypothetical protein ZIOFF_039032 [Zingiber officinale]|uniref:Uncharacterized protein n=1 Tax=Zingiber officinale TaxID=94328 RepID=A0A8J5G2L4_ZINOF|nr:hypothetical protein ZIOFF_039032 [Zingiber officinale]
MEKQSLLTIVGDEEAKVRKSSKFHPSIWGDYFIQNSLSHAEESTQRTIKRVEELKVEVKSMFEDTSDILQLMNLIDSIQMLGLDYHFENEIDKALRLIYEVDDKNYGLYETSLRFRLLRQHGYHVSADIFNKFKDDNGSFISSLNGDAKGLLSLYNVSYLGTHGETILDEAKSFTQPRLVSLLSELEQSLAAQVSLFLEWNYQAVDCLPEYLKDYYLKLLKTCEEFEEELELNEKYRVLYLQDEMKAQVISYLEEARWGIERHVPSLDEHLRNSLISSGCSIVSCASYVGLGEVATKEVFDWHSTFPKAVEACCLIGRLLNDIRSHELEQGRDHTASTVESYMKENDTNVKVACEKLQEIVEKAWKDLNKESLNPTKVPRIIIERIVNLSRSLQEIYKYDDMYTNSDTKMKDNISLVLVESFPV